MDEFAYLLTYQNFFKLWQFQRLSTTTVTIKDTVQTIISPFFPFSLTLITNKIFNAYKKSFLFSLNSYKFIHSIFIRISELIVPITVCFNPRYSTTTKLYFYARCFRNILFFAEEHEVRHTNPRFEIGVKVASESYEFPSLRASFLFSLSLPSPSPFPAAARAFIMEARHHGAKAELMTDVEERPWKRPRFQQWLRGPRRIPGRVRPGGSASDNKGFISLAVVVVVVAVVAAGRGTGLKRVTPRSTRENIGFCLRLGASATFSFSKC